MMELQEVLGDVDINSLTDEELLGGMDQFIQMNSTRKVIDDVKSILPIPSYSSLNVTMSSFSQIFQSLQESPSENVIDFSFALQTMIFSMDSTINV